MDLASNLEHVRSQILDTCKKNNRDPKTIRCIAISKQKPVERIRKLVELEMRDIGENYVQEFLEKQEALQALPIRWHFVGHLQRNKVKDIIGKIALLHSLDSFQLAHEIDKQAAKKKIVQACLLQINLGEEPTKSGIKSDDAAPMLAEIGKLSHIRVTGLMIIPPYFEEGEKSRAFFRQLRETRDHLNRRKIYPLPLTELSMGMSHDFQVAIEEGATFLRIGTALFGERQKQP